MNVVEISGLESLDEGFPRRVFKTSIILSAIFLVYSLFFYSMPVTLGLVIGEAISICSLKILLSTISKFFLVDNIAKKKGSIKKIVTFISTVKFMFFGAILFFVFKYLTVNVLALFVGVSIVQIVIFFKILGLLFVNHLNKSDDSTAGVIKSK